jgi:hypothetical protein
MKKLIEYKGNIFPITIRIKEIYEMRYPTVGDYFWEVTEQVIEKKDSITGKVFDTRIEKVSNLIIEVANTGNDYYNFLVALHEQVELMLVIDRGISIEAIDKFDKKFERERAFGMRRKDEEPGFDPKSPYCKEHRFASIIEELMAKELGVDWNKYNKTVMDL